MSKRDSDKNRSSSDDQNGDLPMGGLLDGFASIIGKLGELAEKGEALHREGNFETGSGKDIRGSYGFSVKLGADGKQSASPVNVKPHKAAAPAKERESAPATREAHVDLFQDGDRLTIIAEMPGVPAENVHLRFDDCKLFMEGKAPRLKFEAEVNLPMACSPEDVSVTANNGVIEIQLKASNE